MDTVGEVSERKVLRSAAGYYIGTEYWDTELNGWFPYDRYSGYYRTADKAQEALNSGNYSRY